VLDEFADQLARGVQPSVEEYACRYQQLGGVLRLTLPALARGRASIGWGRAAAARLAIGLNVAACCYATLAPLKFAHDCSNLVAQSWNWHLPRMSFGWLPATATAERSFGR
jgi:hypothetical protein